MDGFYVVSDVHKGGIYLLWFPAINTDLPCLIDLTEQLLQV